MKQYIKQLILLIATLSSSLPGNAQDSLSYYLEHAALNNPGVKAKYLEYSAALEKVSSGIIVTRSGIAIRLFHKTYATSDGKPGSGYKADADVSLVRRIKSRKR